MQRQFIHLLSALVLAGLSTATPAHAQSQDAPAVGILIDSSRAMGKKIGGITKAALAGNALAANFVKHDSRLNMSLAVFGHLKKDGCAAVDVVQDLEPLRAAAFAKALVDLKTVGVAPLALALDTMATSLSEDANARRIVLITTSSDNCKGDPCKSATRINRRQPQLRVDVIGIGSPESKSLRGLSCVAEKTGGTFAILSDETEIATAIDTAIVKATANASDQAAQNVETSVEIPGVTVSGISTDPNAGSGQSWTNEALTPDPSGSGTEQQSIATAKRGTIRLVAMLTDNHKPIPNGLTWRIFSSDKAKKGGYKLVSEKRDWSPVLELPKGEYLVNAAYGRAHLTRRITISSGPPRVEPFVLQAGGLRLRALNTLGQPVRSNVSYSVLSGDRDQYGKRRTIIANVKPGLIIRLNAGIYNVVSRYGDANAVVQADVTVEPGKLTQIAMTHAGGKATFKLVSKPGGEAIAGTLWSIQTIDGTEIKKSQGALPSHVLAPGSYKVLATQGAQTWGGQFSLGANENKQIEIVIE
ncbi:MAG: hypothetical protein ACR2O4_04360 [Hyphomicrobiaceae bacterium]